MAISKLRAAGLSICLLVVLALVANANALDDDHDSCAQPRVLDALMKMDEHCWCDHQDSTAYPALYVKNARALPDKCGHDELHHHDCDHDHDEDRA